MRLIVFLFYLCCFANQVWAVNYVNTDQGFKHQFDPSAMGSGRVYFGGAQFYIFSPGQSNYYPSEAELRLADSLANLRKSINSPQGIQLINTGNAWKEKSEYGASMGLVGAIFLPVIASVMDLGADVQRGSFIIGQAIHFSGIGGLGFASDKASAGAVLLDPGFRKYKYGWWAYGGGVALMLSGQYLLSNAIDDNKAKGKYYDSNLIPGISLLFVGVMSEFAAWSWFSDNLDRAVKENKKLHLELKPTLQGNIKNQIDGGGLSLSLKF